MSDYAKYISMQKALEKKFFFLKKMSLLPGVPDDPTIALSGGVTSMDDFLKKFFPDVYHRKQAHLHETDYCKYDNQLLTLFTSSLYFAGLVSTFGASYVTKRRGRRASIMVGATSFFLGGAVNAAAMNIAMLIVGRVLLGVGIGFGNQAVPLYLSEIAPYRPGHPRRRHHQLLHGPAAPLGVAPLAGARHGPRHGNLRRRALPAGDAQQPRGARPPGGGAPRAGEGARHPQGGR
jgi:MFS family permease